jgi:hypothetical protein
MKAVSAVGLLACALASAGAACGGKTVNLGDENPPAFHFGTPQELTELDTSFPNDNPTLTADLLELFFTSYRDGISTDVYTARRASTDVPFQAPTLVTEVSTPSFETSSAISADGLTLWFGSDRPGGLGDVDIWMSNRPRRDAAWSPPVNLLSLNSPTKDVPRPTGEHNLVMPLASERDSPDIYRSFLATRASGSAPFGAPQAITELTVANRTTVDASLSDDGLTMFYASGDTGAKLDLYVAWRRTTAEAFSIIVPLDGINTAAEERDPWLSPDGSRLYFTSDRDGMLNIYEVPVTLGP